MVSTFESSPRQSEIEASGPIRAAQYVRMSTDHQRYSTENQSDVIAQYAARHGFDIIRTYADKGKSGLRIEGRDALKQLIADVESGCAGFKAIFVYDVSRWGRFQDADESAYYEYLCRRAGIEVCYCAEQFENDGSIASTIVKTVKRAMAGEYSRELSTKVFAGQCRLVELGFRQGGPAGYGLRRRLIDQNRTPKAALAYGEQKSLQTDRVVLEPGPEEEVETVRWMFRMYVHEKKSESEIAEILNGQKIKTAQAREWSRDAVYRVLTNEKYVGNNVFNKVSFKLKKKRVVNPPDMWIRATGAFPAIVDNDIFSAAQIIAAQRRRRYLSDDEMLERLKQLHQQRGSLSALIIDEAADMPSSQSYRNRFGSLPQTFRLVGVSNTNAYRYIWVNRALRAMHPGVIADVTSNIERWGGRVAHDPVSDLLTINGEFTVSIVIARCVKTLAGSLRWKLRFDTVLRPDITVALRMDSENRHPFDYYLFPRIDIRAAKLRLAERNGVFLDTYRFNSLDHFFGLTARTILRSAA